MLTLRDVQSEADPALAKWLTMYERSFPREVRMPREAIAAQVNATAPVSPEGDVLHVAAALDGDAVVGGAMCTFLNRSNLGFLSYIFIGPETRGRGVGRMGLPAARRYAWIRRNGARSVPSGDHL